MKSLQHSYSQSNADNEPDDQLEMDVFKRAEQADNDVSAEIAKDPDSVQLNEINIFQVHKHFD